MGYMFVILLLFLVLNKKIVILGGVDTSGSLCSTMHEYDPEKDRWKVFGELPRPIKSEYFMSYCLTNQRFWAVQAAMTPISCPV